MTTSPSSRQDVEYVEYVNENDLPSIMELIGKDLSEPYSIFTYRFFISTWPDLCLLARVNGILVGAIVGRIEEKGGRRQGYLAMLAVDEKYRHMGIGSTLARKVIHRFTVHHTCDEISLETEVTNGGALALYGNLGFAKEKRMVKYYLNGVDAFRLKLWLH